jgi:thioester reductase-like protein
MLSMNADERDGGARILLTGATGFFGAFLLTELLATTGRRIACLVRAGDEEHAFRRLRHNLVRYHRWDPSVTERVDVIVGDLAEPRLGLAEGGFAALAASVDTIIHNGAEVFHL